LISLYLVLLLLCTSAWASQAIPGEIALNEGAGGGRLLIIPLHLEDGTELPFIVDTGAPVTFFDVSLQSKLGKPVGEGVWHHFGEKFRSRI
jgi:hypothetical protein